MHEYSITTMEESRKETVRIMQTPLSKGGLGWTLEKAMKWEKNIYESAIHESYDNKVYHFLSNCFQVRELEKQGVQF